MVLILLLCVKVLFLTKNSVLFAKRNADVSKIKRVFALKRYIFWNYKILKYCNVRKSTVFFNPSISNQMSFIVISFDYSDVVGGKQRGKPAPNNHC